MAATTTSSTCTDVFSFPSDGVDPRSVRTSSNHGSSPAGCTKLDGLAMWFINGVASAFFGSLERCSCIHIATVDDGEEANDAPLILNDGNARYEGGTTSGRRTVKGRNTTGVSDQE